MIVAVLIIEMVPACLYYMVHGECMGIGPEGSEEYVGPSEVLSHFLVFVQVLIGLVTGFSLLKDRYPLEGAHPEGWDGYSETVMLLLNSGLGTTLATLYARIVVLYFISAEEGDPLDLPAGRMVTSAFMGAMAIVLLPGFPVGALITHVLPGLIVCLPLFLLAAMIAMPCACPVMDPETDLNPDFPDWQRVMFTAYFGATFMVAFVVFPSYMMQFYAGVPWTDAIQNDAHARSTYTFIECARSQVDDFKGTAAADFISLIL